MKLFRSWFLFFILCNLRFLSAQASSASLQPASPPPEVEARSAVLIDAATGTILYQKNPDAEIPPASLTKLMTIHLALNEVAAGRAAIDEIVPLPPESWARNQPPRSSLMFLDDGQRVTLGELLLGMAVPSGNDAAWAVALRFAPSMDAFAGKMNDEARALGLQSTRFAEASGYSWRNRTTARDFALFCKLYLEAHPQALGLLHSVTRFDYPKPPNLPPGREGGAIVQPNHNPLLETVEGVDGLKTGYIRSSGYNIALTAARPAGAPAGSGFRLIAVILGAPTEEERGRSGRELLEWGFANFKTIRIGLGASSGSGAKPGAGAGSAALPFSLPEARVWKSAAKFAPLRLAEGLDTTAAKNRGGVLGFSVEIDEPLVAPLPEGAQAGVLVISDESGLLRKVPLVLESPAAEGGFWRRTFDAISLFFGKIRKKISNLFA